MSIDVREIHAAEGKLLQFIEEQKMQREIAIAALHAAAEMLQQASLTEQRMLLLAQAFRPMK